MRTGLTTTFLAGLCVAVCIAAPEDARAQRSGSDGDVRVVESVDPVSGRRYRQTMYDLTKKEIRAVQRALRAAGYLGVGWTGRLDHGTVRALNELQEDRGLYRCGCVSYETVVALGLQPVIEVVTVSVGGTVSAEDWMPGWTCHTCGSGIYYPVAVPILWPVGPGGSEDTGHEVETEAPDSYPPPGAVPPGVRPLPPPARLVPATARPGANPRGTP
jgi:hypothetical protein